MNNFNENLRKIRTERKLSLEKVSSLLAHKGIKLSKHGLSAYELGKSEPNIDTIIALAEIFNTSTDSILGVLANVEILDPSIEKRIHQLSSNTNGLFDELINSDTFASLIYLFGSYRNISDDELEYYSKKYNENWYTGKDKPDLLRIVKQDLHKPMFDRILHHILNDLDKVSRTQSIIEYNNILEHQTKSE